MARKVARRRGILPGIIRIVGSLLVFVAKIVILGFYIVSKLSEIILIHLNRAIEKRLGR